MCSPRRFAPVLGEDRGRLKTNLTQDALLALKGLAGKFDQLLHAEAIGKIRAGRHGVALPMQETTGQGLDERDVLIKGRIAWERRYGDFFRRTVFGTAC